MQNIESLLERRAQLAVSPVLQALTTLYRQYDTDGSGQISQDEVLSQLTISLGTNHANVVPVLGSLRAFFNGNGMDMPGFLAAVSRGFIPMGLNFGASGKNGGKVTVRRPLLKTIRAPKISREISPFDSKGVLPYEVVLPNGEADYSLIVDPFDPSTTVVVDDEPVSSGIVWNKGRVTVDRPAALYVTATASDGLSMRYVVVVHAASALQQCPAGGACP